MKVTVLFFGATAVSAQTRTSEIEIKDGSKASDALDVIKLTFPRVAANHSTLLFSVNQTYADGNELINDGDELAVFTPVSGG